LWNELSQPGQVIERGHHAVSDCIALERGVMVEEFDGPYSWNRVSQLLDPAWMREWPESFLTPLTLATGSLAKPASGGSQRMSRQDADTTRSSVLYVSFENLQVGVQCRDAALLERLAPTLGAQTGTRPRNVIARLEVLPVSAGFRVQQAGESPSKPYHETELAQVISWALVEIFARARKGYTWLTGAGLARDGHAWVMAGELGASADALLHALREDGWSVLGSRIIAIRAEDCMVIPLGARSRPEGAAAQTGRIPMPLAQLVLLSSAPLHHGDDALAPVSPASAVAELISTCVDFKLERRPAVERLCRLVESRAVAKLTWNDPQQAVGALRCAAR
jgi:hypothetical protein